MDDFHTKFAEFYNSHWLNKDKRNKLISLINDDIDEALEEFKRVYGITLSPGKLIAFAIKNYGEELKLKPDYEGKYHLADLSKNVREYSPQIDINRLGPIEVKCMFCGHVNLLDRNSTAEEIICEKCHEPTYTGL